MSRLGIALGLSAIVIAGCMPARPQAPSLSSASLYIPKLKKRPTSQDPLAVRFSEGVGPPTGCFALSRRTGAIACVLGHFRVGSDWGERHLSILSNGDEATPDVPLLVQRTDDGLKLEPQSRQLLNGVMRDGDFIIMPAPVSLPTDTPRTFGKLTIELHREEIAMSTVTAWDLKVVVRAEPQGDDGEPGHEAAADVLFTNTLTALAACVDPSLSIRMLEPTIVLVERECRVEDGADAEVTLSAWLCDSDRSRCD